MHGRRARLFDQTVGLSLVRIHGRLHGCPRPSLTIERKKREMTLEWENLFTRFFSERRRTKSTLEDAPISPNQGLSTSHPLSNAFQASEIEVASSAPVTKSPHSEYIQAYYLSILKHSLRALGQGDLELLSRRNVDELIRRSRFNRLSKPVQTWRATAGCTNGSMRMSIQNCRHRRIAELATDLDDNGAVNKRNIDEEVAQDQMAAMARNGYKRVGLNMCYSTCQGNHTRLTILQVWDPCRELNVACEPGMIQCGNCRRTARAVVIRSWPALIEPRTLPMVVAVMHCRDTKCTLSKRKETPADGTVCTR